VPYVNNIRRLTEIECERLQGFPDGWTEFGRTPLNPRGRMQYAPTSGGLEVVRIAKSQRYKMLGNAVTVAMVELIGKRIAANFGN